MTLGDFRVQMSSVLVYLNAVSSDQESYTLLCVVTLCELCLLLRVKVTQLSVKVCLPVCYCVTVSPLLPGPPLASSATDQPTEPGASFPSSTPSTFLSSSSFLFLFSAPARRSSLGRHFLSGLVLTSLLFSFFFFSVFLRSRLTVSVADSTNQPTDRPTDRAAPSRGNTVQFRWCCGAQTAPSSGETNMREMQLGGRPFSETD